MAFLQLGHLQGSPPGRGSPLGRDIQLPLDTQHPGVLQGRSLLLPGGILQEQRDRSTDRPVGTQTPVLLAETQKWDVCAPANRTLE